MVPFLYLNFVLHDNCWFGILRYCDIVKIKISKTLIIYINTLFFIIIIIFFKYIIYL